jgi:hypothetical protein
LLASEATANQTNDKTAECDGECGKNNSVKIAEPHKSSPVEWSVFSEQKKPYPREIACNTFAKQTRSDPGRDFRVETSQATVINESCSHPNTPQNHGWNQECHCHILKRFHDLAIKKCDNRGE